MSAAVSGATITETFSDRLNKNNALGSASVTVTVCSSGVTIDSIWVK